MTWLIVHNLRTDLEADTEREGQGDDDQEHWNAGEDPAAQADSGVVLVSYRGCMVLDLDRFSFAFNPTTNNGILFFFLVLIFPLQ